MNDEETAAFMEVFYHHLAGGKSKVDALRAAKLDMIRRGTPNSVRYWASFILIGEPARSVPISDHGSRARYDPWLLVFPGLVLMALIAFVVFRRRIA